MTVVRYTAHFLNKLESVIQETNYVLRYEKGSFQSGYCVLNEHKVVVINKFFGVEGKINSLIEIIKSLRINPKSLSRANKKIYTEITHNPLSF